MFDALIFFNEVRNKPPFSLPLCSRRRVPVRFLSVVDREGIRRVSIVGFDADSKIDSLISIRDVDVCFEPIYCWSANITGFYLFAVEAIVVVVKVLRVEAAPT